MFENVDFDMVERSAMDSLKRFLHGYLDLPDAGHVDVLCFRDAKGGLRVSEIGYFIPNGPHTGGGAAWMRSDAEAGSVLLAAESALLEYEVDHEHRKSDDDEPDWLCEARERLLVAMFSCPKDDKTWREKTGRFWATIEAEAQRPERRT